MCFDRNNLIKTCASIVVKFNGNLRGKYEARSIP